MLIASRSTRTRFLLLALLLTATVPPAGALLNLDGTRNQIFVFGGLSYAYSSNLFAEPVARGDYTVTAQVGAELQRRAGIIAVNSTAKLDFVRYGEFSDEDTINPNFSLDLTKSTGRTTGALSIQVYRETRSDSAVNLRTSSWNFPIGLSLRYPINEKFYATSVTGYLRRTYSESQSLVDYRDFTQAVDLYYIYTSKLDLLAGYRIRVADTSIDGGSVDHWFNLGATGGLFTKMSGTIRFGYQFRDVSGTGEARYDHFNASGSLNWAATRKVQLALQLNRDFNTIATGASVDSTSVALHGTYNYSRKIDFDSTVSAGLNDFLDQDVAGRRDTFFSWDAGIRYRMNAHIQMGASYTFLQNWSTFSQSDYDNHGFSFNLTGRY
jgi:Putative beta-barrel porin 2